MGNLRKDGAKRKTRYADQAVPVRSPSARITLHDRTTMAKRDHYETLGVARGASDAEVRSAYLLLAKMLHPDRFDPKQQAQEWRKAHEMLLDLNEAYSVLRDPESRRRYDASTSNTDGPRPSRATEEGASQRRSTATDQGARSSATPHEPPSDFGTLQRGARAVSRLPAKIQQRLTEIRSGVLTDATVFTSSCAWYYFGACIGALLLAALFGLANDFLWSEDTRSLYAVLSVAGTAGTWFCLRRTWDWHATAIKNFVAVRPLYVIRAHFGLVEWWPRNHVKEYQRKNHYVNGIPTRTSLQISLPGRVIRIPSAREAQLATLRQGLRTWASRMSALEAPGNLDWLRAADDFQGLSQTAYDPDAGKTFSFARLKRYAAELLLAAGIGVAYFLAIRQANDYFDDKLRWQEAININRASGYRKYLTDRPRGRHVEAARANLNLIYNRASEGYERANVGSDPEAKVAVLRVLKFLGEHNDWKVGTVFERANQIQPDVVQAL
jgi:DnaJ-domain-containing protein 1